MEHLATAFQNPSHRSPKPSQKGFTLLEMIGVLAIMGVLASVIAPNVLKSIDRAAVKAETQSLASIGDCLRDYLIEYRTLPSLATWAPSLSEYTDQNASSLARNPRSQLRTLIYDPATSPSQRAIILSSMRASLSIPNATHINNANRFQTLWDTVDGEIPPTSSWSGWSSWLSVDGAADSLVIERINLKPIFLDELRTSSVALNNPTATIVSYEVEDRYGAALATQTIAPGGSTMLGNLAKGDRVFMYSDAAYNNLVFTYIADGNDRSFDYSTWIASPPSS